MTEFEINKIKLKDGRTTIRYTEPVSGDEFEINSIDPARPELSKALNALVDDVVEICELDMIDEDLHKITVLGVSFTYTQGIGATITALKTLEFSASPLVLNTPHKFSECENEMQMLTTEAVARLKNLIVECNRYINGDRAQGKLFVSNGEEIKPLNRSIAG